MLIDMRKKRRLWVLIARDCLESVEKLRESGVLELSIDG